MERRGHPSIATFFADDSLATGRTVTLSEDVAQHARVRRIEPGDAIHLTNGRGSLATAVLERLTKSQGEARVEQVEELPRPASLRFFVPVADRERMLWLAEKGTELAITAWQPVMFHRSASVSPRGEGEKFAQKVRARMIAALEQSGGAWLPEILPELSLSDALVKAEAQDAARYYLERGGDPLMGARPRAADVMIGPEGGVGDEERLLIIERHHWLPVSLGETTLRFETAGVVAAGILRGLLAK
ncbi:MAG TPA: RsmE family RNA methyltransferase [Gemmatimonadaceae bacterium]